MMNMNLKSANNVSTAVSLFNLKLYFSTFIHIYHKEIILSFTVLLWILILQIVNSTFTYVYISCVSSISDCSVFSHANSYEPVSDSKHKDMFQRLLILILVLIVLVAFLSEL